MRAFVLALALLPVFANAAAFPGKRKEYFDILGSGQKDWRLAFRGTAHIGKSVFEAYKDGSGIPQVVEDGCKAMDFSAECQNHYRNNDALDNWDNVKEVLYGLVDDGMLVKTLRFKGAGSNYLNWMSQDRLLDSCCWEDLKVSGTNYFSVEGDHRLIRRFFINDQYGGCAEDFGWTVVVDQETPKCGWEKEEPFPYIKYVPGVTKTNLNLDNIRSAQAIVVFINYYPGGKKEYIDVFDDGQEWRLAFRGTARVGQPVLPAFKDGTGIPDEVEPGCKSTYWDAPCSSHWRNNETFDNWDKVDQVLLGIIRNGDMVKTAVFNGRNTDYMSWFSLENLIRSCWDDMETSPHNFFSLKGHGPRNFFMSRSYGGCAHDKGWFVAAEWGPKPCPWHTSDAYPLIKYAAGPRHETWVNGQVLEADAFVVLVKNVV